MYDSGGDSKHLYHYGTDTAGFNKDKECTAHNGVLYACMRRNVRSAVQEIQEDKGKRDTTKGKERTSRKERTSPYMKRN